MCCHSPASLPECRPIPDPPPIFDANGADERSDSSISLTTVYLMLSGPRSAEQFYVSITSLQWFKKDRLDLVREVVGSDPVAPG